MATLTPLLLFLFLSFSTTISRGQERAPHGIANESPVTFSPEAYDFFHPDAHPLRSRGPCPSSDCMTWPEAATVKSTLAHQSKSKLDVGKKKLGAGGIATITIALVSALIIGLGVYYVAVTRQTNAARAKAAQELQPSV